MVFRVSLIEKVTFEQRLEGNEGLGQGGGVYLAEWVDVQRPWGGNVLCAFRKHQGDQGCWRKRAREEKSERRSERGSFVGAYNRRTQPSQREEKGHKVREGFSEEQRLRLRTSLEEQSERQNRKRKTPGQKE